MTHEELWQAVLGELELSISRANFTTWFKHSFVVEQGNGKLVIGVPNTFTKTWLENKYHHAIIKAVRAVSQNEVQQVVYQVTAQRSASLPAAPAPAHDSNTRAIPSHDTQTVPTDEFGLNPRYLFRTFVVGKNNELAHAAARAVVEKPGVVYNPLFIYGGVGLGKTHLLQAIGHDILGRTPSLRLVYTSCDKFTSEFVHAIKNGGMDAFEARYRSADLLLIDDIHFIIGKDRTEEQFFHTFNELHQRNKQIVISSDRPPKALPGLEHRLLSRFEWGMIADIGAPDLETRIAIVEAKLAERNYSLAHDIVAAIATLIQSNIRELEGALNRIIAYHTLSGIKPTVESVKNILESMSGTVSRGSINPKHLIKTVSQYYDITIDDIIGESRKKELVTPRQIVMYLMREEIKSSFPSIGSELGGRDHTTAMHAYTKITKEIEANDRIRQDITIIRQRLYSQSV